MWTPDDVLRNFGSPCVFFYTASKSRRKDQEKTVLYVLASVGKSGGCPLHLLVWVGVGKETVC